MKKITSILALALTLCWVSCTKQGSDSINEINDHVTVPEGAIELTTLAKAESTWSLNRRYFDLSFNGNGGSLETRLVGYDAFLTPGQYILGADEIGKAIQAATKMNGKAAQNGYIIVTQSKGKYIVSARIDDEALFWTGDMPFTADPAPMNLPVLQQAQKNQGLVTVQLASTEFTSEFDMTTYQTVLKGDGKYLALDLYSADGYLHDGEYKASAQGGVVNEGEFGIGWDPGDLYGIGMFFSNWGTCLWTVTPDGNNTAEKITGGLVTVSSEEVDDETIWTIYWGLDYPSELIFVGAIPALTKPKPVVSDPTHKFTRGDLMQCSTQAGEIVAGVHKNPITITDDKGKVVAYLEFVLADGNTDLTGEFVSTEYASEAGQLANGYYLDYSQWGYGIIKGGSYYVKEDGTEEYIAPGEVVIVTPIAEDAYVFTGTGFSYPAAGPNYVPSSGGKVYDMTDTVTQDCTDAAGTAYPDVDAHTLVMKDGEEFVAQIKLIRTGGTTDLAGTYTVAEYAHEDLTAGNGFDLGVYFGMEAGAYVIGSYYKKDGAVVIIEPGETITVTSAGANTWKFAGSTGYTFTGKLQ